MSKNNKDQGDHVVSGQGGHPRRVLICGIGRFWHKADIPTVAANVRYEASSTGRRNTLS